MGSHTSPIATHPNASMCTGRPGPDTAPKTDALGLYSSTRRANVLEVMDNESVRGVRDYKLHGPGCHPTWPMRPLMNASKQRAQECGRWSALVRGIHLAPSNPRLSEYVEAKSPPSKIQLALHHSPSKQPAAQSFFRIDAWIRIQAPD